MYSTRFWNLMNIFRKKTKEKKKDQYKFNLYIMIQSWYQFNASMIPLRLNVWWILKQISWIETKIKLIYRYSSFLKVNKYRMLCTPIMHTNHFLKWTFFFLLFLLIKFDAFDQQSFSDYNFWTYKFYFRTSKLERTKIKTSIIHHNKMLF